MTVPLSDDDRRRLDELQRYEVLETPADGAIDAIARLAALVCGTPSALVTFIDGGARWTKSVVGDAALALVSDPAFHAEAPLVTPAGVAIGTLAVVDSVPRLLSDEQREGLATLAAAVMTHLDLHRTSLETTRAEHALLGMLRDQHAVEQSLRGSETRYRMLFARNPAPMWVFDLETLQFLAVNSAALEHYGYSEAEFLAMRITDIRDAEDVPVLAEALAEMQGGRQTTLTRHRKRDGSHIDVEVTGDDLTFDGRAARLVLVNDITARRAAEARVAEQAALLDEAGDAILLTDLEQRVLFWNRGAERLYGWSAAEATGKRTSELHHPDDSSRRDALSQLLENGRWEGALPQRTREGEALTVESRWALTRDADGTPKSILVFNTDVTERKRTESQRLRAQRMESIGTLAGGIAHDLNNVLAPMMMSLALLRDRVSDENSAELLRTVEASATRGAELVQQVLSFARGVEGQRVPVSPALLVREVQRIIRDSFPKSILTNVRCDDEVWSVNGDPTQLHQVILNLCVNARDAMPGGGELHIVVENARVDTTHAASITDARPGHYVLVQVRDTGAGIAPEIRDRIFEPFFSTKELGKGTGLGLSTSLAIVRSHGGFISLYSEPDRGATFRVYLPASLAVAPQASEIIVTATLPRGDGETVLVVDDEEAIRRIAQRTLERYGYRVITAEHGADALSVFAANRDMIDVVVTDMAMPIMDGAALIAAIHAIEPTLPIIGSSGLATSDTIQHGDGTAPVRFVAKPYTADALLRALREALMTRDDAGRAARERG